MPLMPMTDTHDNRHTVPVDDEDPQIRQTLTIGLAGAFFFIALVLFVVGLNYAYLGREHEVKVEALIRLPAMHLAGEQRARLEVPVHRELRPENEPGVESLVIPIDEAMDRIVERAQRRDP